MELKARLLPAAWGIRYSVPINFCNRSRDLSPRLPQAPLVSDSKVGVDSLISWRPFPEEQRCHDEDGGDWAGKGGSAGAGNSQIFQRKTFGCGSILLGWLGLQAPAAPCSSLPSAPLTSLCLRSLEETMPRFEPGTLTVHPIRQLCVCVGQGELALELCVCDPEAGSC